MDYRHFLDFSGSKINVFIRVAIYFNKITVLQYREYQHHCTKQ